ncbi:MAG TPA: lysylphosphatidylglycerol synthase transmembrane domain-containing protein [Bryobacteraceae bacterium]|nr:lysylphosphatidylglycerol synthase transmembrane domain-containing protein [Bryobacteraceae bacterium]
MLLLLVALYLLRTELRKSGFHWAVFVATLAGLDWRWLVASLGFGLATYYGRALRWAVLLRPLRPHPDMWGLFTSTVIGFTAVTLLGRPGEFVRPYLIAVKEKVPFSSQIAAWVLERIYDLLIALAIFGFALSRLHNLGDVGPALSWVLEIGGWLVWILSALCLLALAGIRRYSETMRQRLMDALGFLSEHHLERAGKFLQALVQGAESTRSHKSIILLVLYTIFEWALIAVCYLCITRAFGAVLHFTLVDVLIFMGFVSFGAVVQIPGIGGGIQVVAVLVLTKIFGMSVELATSIAVMVWAITFVVIVPFGLAIALHEGLSWRRLRDLEREANA